MRLRTRYRLSNSSKGSNNNSSKGNNSSSKEQV